MNELIELRKWSDEEFEKICASLTKDREQEEYNKLLGFSSAKSYREKLRFKEGKADSFIKMQVKIEEFIRKLEIES